MAKIKFVLDKQVRKDGTNIVMLSFIHKGFRKQATLGIKVSPENWDAENCLVSTKEKNHRHINQLENPRSFDPLNQRLIDPLKFYRLTP